MAACSSHRRRPRSRPSAPAPKNVHEPAAPRVLFGMALLALVFAAGVVSADIPTRLVDSSWRALAESEHYRGRWRIEIAGRPPLTGDWIIRTEMPRGHGSRNAILFVSSTASTVCELDATQPWHLICDRYLTGAVVRDHLVLPRGPTPLDRYCAGTCPPTPTPVGAITVDVAPVRPTLAEEELLFERVTGGPIAARLGAARTRTPSRLELRWHYDVHGEQVHANPPSAGFSRPVTRAEAVLRIGPAPTEISLFTRETDRFVEDCTYPVMRLHGSSCSPKPPICVRRTTSAPRTDRLPTAEHERMKAGAQ